MRILVLSDIHHRWVRAQSLIDTVPHDKVVLLGDYFDQFNDNIHDAHNTATWLKDMVIPNPNIVQLIGNHDQYYFWHWYPHFRGSGYSDAKRDAIRSVLQQDHVKQFKFFHIEENIVFSHAGISGALWKEIAKYNIIDKTTNLENFSTVMTEMVAKNLECVDLLRPAPLFMAGWDRGGTQRHGGLTWSCWSSFGPVKGINQVVGHTPHYIPEFLVQSDSGSIKKYSAEKFNSERFFGNKKVTSINLALDTHSEHYAIVEDGRIEIYDANTRLTIKEMIEKGIPFSEKQQAVINPHLAEKFRQDAIEEAKKKSNYYRLKG